MPWFNAPVSRRQILTGGAITSAAAILKANSAFAWPIGLRGAAKGSSTILADVVIYGATPSGVCAAYEAARNGAKVVLCGGWREVNLGGIMSGGLGTTDASKLSVFSGLAYVFFSRVMAYYGRGAWPPSASSQLVFEPKVAQAIFTQMLAEYSVQIFWTSGVSAVNFSGTNITGFQTTDGKVFAGKYFIDSSVELDLVATAGILTNVTRAPLTTSGVNGYDSADGYQTGNTAFSTSLAGSVTVDPYITPGNSGSGLIAGVIAQPSTTAGQGDNNNQAYNFRQTVCRSTATSIYYPLATAPRNYNSANYELFGRMLANLTAAGKTFTGTDSTTTYGGSVFFFFGSLPNSKNDMNNNTALGDDYVNGQKGYISGTYAQREVLWQAEQDYWYGFLYYLAHDTDTRIPAALQTYVASFGLCSDEFTNPHPNDVGLPHFSYCMYVRTARRLASSNPAYTYRASDAQMADGTTPRISTNTVAAGSYTLDLHAYQRFNKAGLVASEGGLNANAGGTDAIFPIPAEACLPDDVQCTNLAVTAGVNSSTEAYAGVRIEDTMMMIGQSMGLAAAMASASSQGTTLRQVLVGGYSTFRSQIQSEDGAYKIVLPQVN